MQAQGQLITIKDGSGAKALIAPELGAWLLRYTRHLPDHGDVDGLYFDQQVVNRYPNQMYAGNPLLFPQVSYSHLPGKEHHYSFNGHLYSLPQHGFARRSKWRVIGVDESRLSMELTDTPETRRTYPFTFRTEVTYELRDGRLHYEQIVENSGSEPMPFSTGIHPYLPVPITPTSQRNACYVQLPAARRVVPTGDWQAWSAEAFAVRQLPVQEDVSGTLFLTDLAAPEISLVDPTAALQITLNFAESPQHRFVAIWSKSTTDPFYCIEPWTALPNSLNRQNSELILLPPGATLQSKMWINISRL